MKKSDRNIINAIIAINPYLRRLEKLIEEEQEDVLKDLISPAKVIVQKLIALDNRRIDICNLIVMYAFMERGMGERFCVLKTVAESGGDSPLYGEAAKHIESSGYSLCRAGNELGYLLKPFIKNRRKKPSVTEGADMPVFAVQG